MKDCFNRLVRHEEQGEVQEMMTLGPNVGRQTKVNNNDDPSDS